RDASSLRVRRSAVRRFARSIASRTRFLTSETSIESDRPFLAQRADLVGTEPQVARQYRFGVLTERRRRASDAARRRRELHRYAEEVERADRGVIDRGNHLACRELRIREHFFQIPHRSAGNAT